MYNESNMTGTFGNPDEEILRSMNPIRKDLLEKNNQSNELTHRKEIMNGREVEFDVSSDGCHLFGFDADDELQTPHGKLRVFGVLQNQLWFKIGDQLITFGKHDAQYYKSKGFVKNEARIDIHSFAEKKREYNVGDRVIGNAQASEKYLKTIEGWVGEIVKIDRDSDRDIQVRNGGTEYWVDSDCFDPYEGVIEEKKEKFKLGDKIIANEKANAKYSITKKGWEGEVIKICSDHIHVTGKGMRDEKVDPACFDLIDSESKETTESKKDEESEEAPIVERIMEKKEFIPPIPPIEIDLEKGVVYVLETELPLNLKKGKNVPRAEDFVHFTLDERTLKTLEKIATAVELHDPCLLEGGTATSKTSSIMYMAMVTGNEVLRLNLNGQTDTSELIGKFVPNDGKLEIRFKDALQHPELLNEQSLDILHRANEEGRGLTMIESQKIAQNEGLEVSDWRWQDGMVPEALKTGAWIILDEINLAEAQILERLNSVLERNSSLTISENGGTRIGNGGDFETNSNFRIFATMNPAEFTGRQPMSPAYKDRWVGYDYIDSPTDDDYRAMFELMVYGTQPKVEIRGTVYHAADVEPMLEKVKNVPNMRGFLGKLAKFQAALEMLVNTGEIGKSKREPYIFTRRGLLEFFEYLEVKKIVDRKIKQRYTIENNPKEIILRAIENYFLDKFSNNDDLKKVEDLLDSIGISRKNWLHKFEEISQTDSSEKTVISEKIESRKGGKIWDASELLTAFAIHRKTKGGDPDQWVWSISENGKIIDMKVNTSDSVITGSGYVDRKTKRNLNFFETSERGQGISELLVRLEGKKVKSLDSDGKWFLEIVE